MKLFCPQGLLSAGRKSLQPAAFAGLAIAWVAVLLLLGPPASQGSPLVIDDFAYTNTAAARQESLLSSPLRGVR